MSEFKILEVAATLCIVFRERAPWKIIDSLKDLDIHKNLNQSSCKVTTFLVRFFSAKKNGKAQEAMILIMFQSNSTLTIQRT